MNIFEDLEKDLEVTKERLTAAVQAGVTVDVAVRLSVFTAAKALSPSEFEKVRQGIEGLSLENQWPEDSEERVVAVEAIKNVLDSVEKSQAAFKE